MSGVFVSMLQVVRLAVGFAAMASVPVTGLHVATAQEASVLSPSSAWNLNYGEDRCRLLRTFGDDDSPTVLIMEQVSPSDHFELIIAGDTLRWVNDDRHATLQMGPGYEAFERRFHEGTLGEIKSALVFGSISPVHGGLSAADKPASDEASAHERILHPMDVPLAESGANIEWIEFAHRNRVIRLNTGPLAKALEGLTTCTADLVRSWGLDPEAVASVVANPEITNIEHVTRRIQRTYPSKALRRGEMATIHVRTIIDEHGQIASCTQLELTKAENFADAACNIILREAKFEPARDTSGKPVRMYSTNRIRYIIP